MKTGITILLLVCSFSLLAQNFTGEITYSIEVQAKQDSVDLEEIRDSQFGTKSIYLITEDHYKSTYYKEGKYTYSYIYHSETGLLYDDEAGKPYVTFRNTRKPANEYPGSEVLRIVADTILGYKCFPVISNTSFGKRTTFYSDELRINYEGYQGHELGNWFDRLKEVNGCIELKSINEYDDYYLIMEAIKIKEKKVKPRKFKLPKSKPIIASYVALDKQVELAKPGEDQIKCYKEKVEAKNKSTESVEMFYAYVSFMLTSDGEIQYLRPLQNDEFGYYEVAMDIINTCDIDFVPGEINGVRVDSEVFFPIRFN